AAGPEGAAQLEATSREQWRRVADVHQAHKISSPSHRSWDRAHLVRPIRRRSYEVPTLVQIDHLAVDPDLALGIDLDLVVTRECERFGRSDLDALGGDLDGLGRPELQSSALHLQHRAFFGQPDPDLD